MRKILKPLLILAVFACLLAACGVETEEPDNKKNNTATEAVGTSTPEAAESPTPEPTAEPEPVEEFVELTDEEITELTNQVRTYYPNGYYITGFIVAYYKYIGLEDLEVPVLLYYQPEEAEELFGGEWEQLPEGTCGFLPDGFLAVPVEEQSWLVGTLTIARIEQELMYGEAQRVTILGDDGVESAFVEADDGMQGIPALHPFTEYMRWLRYYGQYHLVDQGTYFELEVPPGLD